MSTDYVCHSRLLFVRASKALFSSRVFRLFARRTQSRPPTHGPESFRPDSPGTSPRCFNAGSPIRILLSRLTKPSTMLRPQTLRVPCLAPEKARLDKWVGAREPLRGQRRRLQKQSVAPVRRSKMPRRGPMACCLRLTDERSACGHGLREKLA